MSGGWRQGVVPAYLLLCLLFGGSGQGVWRNLVLQLVGLGIIAWTALQPRSGALSPPLRQLAALVALVLLVLVVQLIPLPPEAWTRISGRDVAAEGYRLMALPLPWLPLSLTPYETSAALLALVPPLAIVAAVVRSGAWRRDWCIAALAAGAAANVALGAAQVSGSGLYLYLIHNEGVATGLFANANHLGTLLLATVPFLALAGVRRRSRDNGERWSRLALAGAGMLLAGAGMALTGSLAVLILAIPVTAASLVLVLRGAQVPRGWLWAGLAVLAAVAGAAALWSPRLSAANQVSVASRQDIHARTVQAIGDFLPVGSGVGSFDKVYPLYEDGAAVDRWYVNRAHSDYLEVALETGLPGLLLMAAFLWWWARRAVALWRTPDMPGIALAATIASGAILAHSMVDYPLRTTAVAALFGLCVGVMAQPRRQAVAAKPAQARPARHLALEASA